MSEVSLIADKMPKYTRGVWLLMNDTGLRVSDAIGVKYSDIDKAGYLHYVAQKTGKSGRAKLSDSFIREYVGNHRTGAYLFPSPKKPGEHVCRSTVFRHIKNACRALQIDPTGIAPHSARKSFAVRDFREYGLGRVMHDLQHRDASTTLLYAMSDNAIQALYKEIRKLQNDMEDVTEKLDILFDEVFGDKLNITLTCGKKKPQKRTKKGH